MTLKVVVDSSVMVKWVNTLEEKHLVQAQQLLEDWSTGKIEVIAPELARYEVCNAVSNKGMTVEELKESIHFFSDLPIRFIAQNSVLARKTADIVEALHITWYDASFLALAEQEEIVLITANPKHQKNWKEIRAISLNNYSIDSIKRKK